MRALSYPLAVLIILVVPLAAVAAGAALLRWAGWVVRVGGPVGMVGLAITAGCALNLAVPRTCDEQSPAAAAARQRNRPAISLVTADGACFRSAVAQVQLAVLAGLATSVVVSLRRSAEPAAASTP